METRLIEREREIEQIQQVLGNLVRTYTITKTYGDKDTLRLVIFAAAEFVNPLTEGKRKDYITGQFIFGRDIILPIKHTVE